jgi:hypothetical protein
MEDNFALRYVFTYPGIISCAEIGTLARRFAPLARQAFSLAHKNLNIKILFKNSLIIHEENTKKNHKRVASLYVIEISRLTQHIFLKLLRQ